MRYLSLLLLVFGCGPGSPGEWTRGWGQRGDPFGLFGTVDIREWSALWAMRHGEIGVCLRGARDGPEIDWARGAIRDAVTGWVGLLGLGPPGPGYPEWKHETVWIRWTCQGHYYTVVLSDEWAWCDPVKKTINVHHGAVDHTFAHELGHAMGLSDTYRYTGGYLPDQPDALMRDSPWFTPDDHHGVWRLWRYLSTGILACPPGYQRSRVTSNHEEDYLCGYRPEHSGLCHRTTATQWLCRTACLTPGQCPRHCTHRCQDYGVNERECRGEWVCQQGCLYYAPGC